MPKSKSGPLTRSALCDLQCKTLEGVDLDVSCNSSRVTKASEFLNKEQKKRPSLKPLTLLLKAFLRANDLHDVFKGSNPEHSQ